MRSLRKMATVFLTISFLLLLSTGCSSKSDQQASTPANDPAASGTVVIDETQAMLIVGGSYGGGTLNFQGQTHKFKAKGLKLGGVGVHKMHLTGDVYKLNNLADFSGTYFVAEAGITVVKGAGGFWLKNTKGVTLHLKSSNEGLALAVGVEGLHLSMD